MNKVLVGGVVLVILGIAFLVLGNVNFQTQEEVFRLGNLSATAATSKTIPAFRYAGIAALAAGLVMTIFGYKSRRNG